MQIRTLSLGTLVPLVNNQAGIGRLQKESFNILVASKKERIGCTFNNFACFMTLLSVNLLSFPSNQKTDSFNRKHGVLTTRAEKENWSLMQIVEL